MLLFIVQSFLAFQKWSICYYRTACPFFPPLNYSVFYEDWSFMMDEERSSMIPTMAAGKIFSSVLLFLENYCILGCYICFWLWGVSLIHSMYVENVYQGHSQGEQSRYYPICYELMDCWNPESGLPTIQKSSTKIFNSSAGKANLEPVQPESKVGFSWLE